MPEAAQEMDYLPCLICGKVPKSKSIPLFKVEIFERPEEGFAIVGICLDCCKIFGDRSLGFYEPEFFDTVAFAIHVNDDIERISGS